MTTKVFTDAETTLRRSLEYRGHSNSPEVLQALATARLADAAERIAAALEAANAPPFPGTPMDLTPIITCAGGPDEPVL